MIEKDLIYRLRKRAEIRRGISSRKSVQEGKPDRLADLLDEAADALGELDQMRAERKRREAKCLDAWGEDCEGSICRSCFFCQGHAYEANREANRQGEGMCPDCIELKP